MARVDASPTAPWHTGSGPRVTSRREVGAPPATCERALASAAMGDSQQNRPGRSSGQTSTLSPAGPRVPGGLLADPGVKDLAICPACHGTSKNPDAPAAIAADFGTCLICCYPLHPQYAAHMGYVLPLDPPPTAHHPSPPRPSRTCANRSATRPAAGL